jgi:trimeric autotransporter adhesin
VASANTIVGNRISFGATATFDVGLLRVGRRQLAATYADHATFTGSSAAGDIEVTRAAVAPSVTQALASSAVTTSVLFTASLTPVVRGIMPTGYVQFYRGSTAIGAMVRVDAAGRARLGTTDLPRGANNITARYLGDVNYLPTTSTGIVHTRT